MPPEVNVHVATSTPTRLTMDLPGRAAAYRVAEVRPQVNGILQKRLFEEGALVKAGQVLYQIDPALYEAALASAQASLAQAEATAYSAKLLADRYQVLVKTQAVSQQDWVNADAALKQARAAIAAAKAAVNTAKINLDYTKVKAPISGKIGSALVSEGGLMTAQQANPLATIQQIDPLYVDVTQSSIELLHLQRTFGNVDGNDLSSGVNVFLEDNTPYNHEATLKFSDVSVDPSTSSVTIRATVPNPEHFLLPGMYLRAHLTSAREIPAIAVPQQCIQRDNRANPLVMVVNGQGLVEARPVVLGQNMGNNKVVVTTGLKDGDKVVFAGFQKIRPGAPAKIVETPVDQPANAAKPASTGEKTE
ncbi:MAG TPA: efflux transporter periplasmic adaptor subunit [Desulfobulbaceae bacterium]|nr:efflux transporter periplasmic adaptor subunit [Desulfobulbaceae bacterium]